VTSKLTHIKIVSIKEKHQKTMDDKEDIIKLLERGKAYYKTREARK